MINCAELIQDLMKMRIRYVLKSASQSMVSAVMYIIMTCFKFLLCGFGSVVCITRNKFGTCTM